MSILSRLVFVAALAVSGQSNSAGATEFRHALLMDSSGDKASAARIDKLKKALERKGFEVTHLPDARKDGYPVYQRFVRGLPAKGKSIIYYCGDIDIVHDERNRRDSYRFQLGKYRFLPPDGFPGHTRREVSDAEISAEPGIPNRHVDGRSVQVFAPASSAQLMVLDIGTFHQSEKPEIPFERHLNGGRFILMKPELAEAINVYIAKKENAGAALAEKLAAALTAGCDPRPELSRSAIVLGAEDLTFELHGEPARVISPPEKLISGKKAGDQWLDPHGICFLWVPPGHYTMGSADFPDTQPVRVSITEGFWMSKYELTRTQGRLFGFSSKGGSWNTPVGMSDRTRLLRNIRNQNLYMKARGRSLGNWSYDIPSEAEWEYAARAGETKGAPAAIDKMGEFANFADRTLYGVEGIHGEQEHLYAYQGASDGVGLGTAEVGSYRPNAWGFHDMLGNRAEWCADYYKPELDGGADPLDQFIESDRKIHARNGVYRGGAWCTRPDFLSYAYRGFSVPRSSTFLGVRLVVRQGERRAKTAVEILAEKKTTASD